MRLRILDAVCKQLLVISAQENQIRSMFPATFIGIYFFLILRALDKSDGYLHVLLARTVSQLDNVVWTTVNVEP